MRTRRQRSSSDPVPRSGHRSVLLHESLESLAIEPNDIVVDATLGGAGHAKEIVKRLGANGIFVGIDADRDAIERAEVALKSSLAQVISLRSQTAQSAEGVGEPHSVLRGGEQRAPRALRTDGSQKKTGPTVFLVHGNFRDIESHLGKHGIQHITKALFDLGWSGFQLAAGRGFSFTEDGPLYMTYADAITPKTLTAERIVNTWGEESIADVIYGWGEERYSRQIARGIVEARQKKPIQSPRELAEIIAYSVPAFYRRGRIHPATKTFQALRIAVNDEMGALKQGLASVWKMLQPNGRLAVISFHSVEDRDVKRFMLEKAQTGEAERMTKSPIRPSREEVLANPRSRSAKLRVIRKL